MSRERNSKEKSDQKNNAEKRYFLTGEGGGSRQLLVLADEKGNMCQHATISHPEGITVDKVRDQSITKVLDMIKKQGITNSDIEGIGIGSAGFVADDHTLFGLPNIPKSLERIEFVSFIGDYLGIKNRIALNDCAAGAVAANHFGHKRNEILFNGFEDLIMPWCKPLPDGKFFSIRLRPENKHDKTRKDYVVSAYVTISSGNNYGWIFNPATGKINKGKMHYIMNGEFGRSPEAGHQYYKEKDVFGNLAKCGCGATGCIEQHLAGGNQGNGLIGILRRTKENGQITHGAINAFLETFPDTREANIHLPKFLYSLKKGDSCDADMLKDAIAEAVAYQIGSMIGHIGPGKIEFGGSMMRDYRQILLPALEKIRDDYRKYCNQPMDYSSFPDICVAKNYGKDYIWQGPVAVLLEPHKYKKCSD